MAIKKQFVKTKPVCKVTFSVEAKEAAEVAVVGDFNNWDPKEGALNKLKNGTFKGVFSIDKDAEYEFKYVIDGGLLLTKPRQILLNGMNLQELKIVF
jgi:1,4-alpha-glucan branching enzyme